jgi:ribose 1,5-bisphosphokinase
VSGRLVYVMGPSGAGKDTLLGHARAQLEGGPFLFAHRYITRPADAGGENHVALSPAEFAWRDAQGLFALAWHSHALSYGIGREIDAWLAGGATVVVNGSRAHCAQACAAYPDSWAVLIEASPEVLAERLAARGREGAEQVRARLARQPAFALPPGVRLARIDNSGALADGVAALVALLRAAAAPHAGV